jgi:hypothetical protein
MYVINELLDRREAERKLNHEKMIAKWEAKGKKGSHLPEGDGQDESRPRRT